MVDTKGGRAVGKIGKGRGKKSGAAAEGGSRMVGVGDEDSCCVGCGREVLGSQQGLKCDACGFWHHAGCEGVSEEVYDFLCAHGEDESLIWNCRKCVVTCKRFMKLCSLMHESQMRMEERIEEISNDFSKRIVEMEGRFRGMLDGAVAEIRDVGGVGVGDGEGLRSEEPQRRIEEKMDVLMEKVNAAGRVDCHLVHDCVEDAILLRMAEEQEEAEEMGKRKSNIVMFGVVESKEQGFEKRRLEDEVRIQEIFHEIGCDNTTVNRVVRMGRRAEGENGKPRPMLVTMASETQKDQVLIRAKNLRRSGREGLDKVYIFQDLTPRQRERRKKLVTELRERQERGEANLIIVNGKIVTKRGAQASDGVER